MFNSESLLNKSTAPQGLLIRNTSAELSAEVELLNILSETRREIRITGVVPLYL
ncbi:hypothetical protein LIHA111178_05970 [Litorimonas haliclonae]